MREPVLDVLEALYDAAMDESRWSAALEKLAAFTGSQAATFWVLDGPELSLPIFRFVNIDPAFIRDYLKNVAPLDPTVQYLAKHPHEPIVHDGLVISEREKDRHPYYDWHHRSSDLRFRLIGRVSASRDIQAGVALHRTRTAGRFEHEDLDRFRRLAPHLTRALQIAFKLGTVGTMQQLAVELLDRKAAAIVLLDVRLRVVYANAAAETLCASGDGVSLSAAGLSASRKQDDYRLVTLLARAAGRDGSRPAPTSGAMRITRPSGKRPYAVLVSPVTRSPYALSTLRPAVCVIISDPEADPAVPSETLQAAFGLTEAEARLAALLCAGPDLRRAAERLEITYGTARVRLAVVFAKTETHSQAELIKLLLTTISAD